MPALQLSTSHLLRPAPLAHDDKRYLHIDRLQQQLLCFVVYTFSFTAFGHKYELKYNVAICYTTLCLLFVYCLFVGGFFCRERCYLGHQYRDTTIWEWPDCVDRHHRPWFGDIIGRTRRFLTGRICVVMLSSGQWNTYNAECNRSLPFVCVHSTLHGYIQSNYATL